MTDERNFRTEFYRGPDPRRTRLLDRRNPPDGHGPLRSPSRRHPQRGPYIRSAALSAFGFSPIFSWIGETTVAFSNGVTKASGAAPHPDYASFSLALDIPSVVSRSTNELLHWSATSVNGHELPSSVYIATNGPRVAYSILDEPVLPWTDDDISETNVWVSALDFLTPTNVCGNVASNKDFLKRLARFLFEDYDLIYDTVAGDVHYLDNVDQRFLLGSYISGKSSRRSDTVNCFDQAVSLCLLGRLTGNPTNAKPVTYTVLPK